MKPGLTLGSKIELARARERDQKFVDYIFFGFDANRAFNPVG